MTTDLSNDRPTQARSEQPDGPNGLSHEKLLNIAGKAEKNYLKALLQLSDVREKRHSEPESATWRYFWKPLPTTLGFGVPGIIMLLFGAFVSSQTYFEVLGHPPGWVPGTLRLCLMLAGAYLVFIAFPYYKPRDWTPDEQLKQDHDKLEFQEHNRR